MRQTILHAAILTTLLGAPTAQAETTRPSDTDEKLQQRLRDLEDYTSKLEKQLGEEKRQWRIIPGPMPKIYIPTPTPPSTTKPAPPDIRIWPPGKPMKPEEFLRKNPDAGWHERKFNGRSVYIVPLDRDVAVPTCR